MLATETTTRIITTITINNMSNYSTLKTAIQQAVYTNGNGEITGAGLQSVLLQIVNTVGDGYVFKGVANAGTVPGTPDANVFYFAPPGVYSNFGSNGYTVHNNNIGIFVYNGSWSKVELPVFLQWQNTDQTASDYVDNLVKNGLYMYRGNDFPQLFFVVEGSSAGVVYQVRMWVKASTGKLVMTQRKMENGAWGATSSEKIIATLDDIGGTLNEFFANMLNSFITASPLNVTYVDNSYYNESGVITSHNDYKRAEPVSVSALHGRTVCVIASVAKTTPLFAVDSAGEVIRSLCTSNNNYDVYLNTCMVHIPYDVDYIAFSVNKRNATSDYIGVYLTALQWVDDMLPFTENVRRYSIQAHSVSETIMVGRGLNIKQGEDVIMVANGIVSEGERNTIGFRTVSGGGAFIDTHDVTPLCRVFSFTASADLNYMYIYYRNVPAISGEILIVHGKFSQFLKKTPRTFSVLGDSWSAFEGFVYPLTNSNYYPHANNDVSSAKEMWWHLLAKNTGMVIDKVAAYNGSPICYDGLGEGDEDARDKCFISRRFDVGTPDVLFIQGGTNDSTAQAALGEYMYSGWTDDDLKSFRPAVAFLIDYYQTLNPSMKIVFLMESGMGQEYKDSITTICAYYNVQVATLSSITRQEYHPSVEGMIQVASIVGQYV